MLSYTKPIAYVAAMIGASCVIACGSNGAASPGEPNTVPDSGLADAGESVNHNEPLADAASSDAAQTDASRSDAAAAPADASSDTTSPIVPELHITGGTGHSCAWRDQGIVSCWGSNRTGEVGDGTKDPRLAPVVLPGIRDVLQISVGDWSDGGFTCALTREHTVLCWGQNSSGQLGDGTLSPERLTPAPVRDLTDVVELASSTNHTCARLVSGSIKCWGFGRDCALGNGGCATSALPVSVRGIDDAEQLAVGMTWGCARRRAGRLTCWGSNNYGEVGNGSEYATPIPVDVTALTEVVSVVGDHTVVAQTATGQVYGWGTNEYGWLGLPGNDRAIRRPTLLPDVPGNSRLMPGGRCVLTTAAEAFCWGALGHREVARVPLANVTSVSGAGSLFATLSNGHVFGWGFNSNGQLGDGTKQYRETPVEIVVP